MSLLKLQKLNCNLNNDKQFCNELYILKMKFRYWLQCDILHMTLTNSNLLYELSIHISTPI